MKVLVIGLGSMGTRRVRNLRALGVRDIAGYEPKQEKAKELDKLGIELVPALKDLKQYDLIVISTIPGAHLAYARACAKAGVPFFVELNLETQESRAIERLAKKHRVRAFFSNTEYFDEDVARVGAEVGKGFKGYFFFHLGQNIHDWHPWKKKGEHFIFKPRTNGIREMLRVELPWMLKLFGRVEGLSVESARVHTKKYGIDDYMVVHVHFKSGARGVLVLDLVAPEVVKRFEATDARKQVVWKERENVLEVYRQGKGKHINLRGKQRLAAYKFHEDAHLAEMAHVLAVLKGKETSKLLAQDELDVLSLIDKIERTAHKR